jgi:hypothetical protein
MIPHLFLNSFFRITFLSQADSILCQILKLYIKEMNLPVFSPIIPSANSWAGRDGG